MILMERNPRALAIIRENLRSLAIKDEATVVRGRAATLIAHYKADIVFLDPPYEQLREYSDCLLAVSAGETPLAVAQHASRVVLEEEYGVLKKTRVLKQGDNSLSFFSRQAIDAHP